MNARVSLFETWSEVLLVQVLVVKWMHDQCSSCVLLDVYHLFVSDRVKSLDCGAPAVDLVSVFRCFILAFLIRAPPLVAVCDIVRTGFMAEV